MDETPKKRPLSEIGHLFLSSVRDRHMGGATPPRRTPPGQQAIPGTGLRVSDSSRPAVDDSEFDTTMDDLLGVLNEHSDDSGPEGADLPRRPVTAVIAGHLAAAQMDRVKQYARHLAAECGARVGVIEVDTFEFRLMCFDPDPGAADAQVDPIVSTAALDPREVSEAIEEMHWDVAHWLVVAPNPRVPEARDLLAGINRWTLLTTCDHDGVVSAYRMLKSLADQSDATERPSLSVSVLDAPNQPEASRVMEKLIGVCRQFLAWNATPEAVVGSNPRVTEHLVMYCRPARDQGSISEPPQWFVVHDFLSRAAAPLTETVEAAMSEVTQQPAVSPAADAFHQQSNSPDVDEAMQELEDFADVTISRMSSEPARGARTGVAEASRPVKTRVAPTPAPSSNDFVIPMNVPAAPVAASTTPEVTAPKISAVPEVIELPSSDAPAEAILSAVLYRDGSELAACPLRPPMCPEARLAVDRDRSLVLLAVARQGLGDLRAIGQAYQWLAENRTLIGMAVPQFALDPNLAPKLRLLVDQSDVSAAALQPLLRTGHVSLQPYRRLRWGGKTGLLLEAA